MVDPFAKVRGKGVGILRRAGIAVDVGLCGDAARELNGSFIKRVTRGMPWVVAKWAQTLDGCVATASGESKWISSEASRAEVQTLRGRMDAIIVGLGTAEHDDPLLMARPERARDLRRIATRIVLDSQCRLNANAQLIRTIAFAPVMVVHGPLDRAGERRRAALEARGVLTVKVAGDRAGRPRIGALLKYLGGMEYANVLVEGGPEVMAAFLRGGFVDEAWVYVAPTVLGGKNSRHAVGGEDLRRLADATALEIRAVSQVGPDMRIIAATRLPGRAVSRSNAHFTGSR
jgi:diaminohydroxyphosphoribosylaminopyrimidine deaminase/5-amino-6-(5-phosphoribosylamino)uracil reductase